MVLDYTSYYFNLSNANLNDDPAWQVEYEAKVSYTVQVNHIDTDLYTSDNRFLNRLTGYDYQIYA